MPSLIEQLQQEALDANVTLSDVLRKARVVALKLGLREPAEWIEHELSGYLAGSTVPDYRTLVGMPQMLHPVLGWRPLAFNDAETNQLLSMALMRQPAAEIERLLAYDGPIATYEPRQVQMLREATDTDFAQAGVLLGKSSLVAVLDAIRNRILDWSVQLELAGVRGEGTLSFSKRDREAAAAVTFNISGGTFVGAVGPVSGHASVTASNVTQPQLDAALRSLADQITALKDQMGLTEENKARLNAAAAELTTELAKPAPDQSMLRQLVASIRQVAEGAMGNIVASGALHFIAQLPW